MQTFLQVVLLFSVACVVPDVDEDVDCVGAAPVAVDEHGDWSGPEGFALIGTLAGPGRVCGFECTDNRGLLVIEADPATFPRWVELHSDEMATMLVDLDGSADLDEEIRCDLEIPGSVQRFEVSPM